MSQVTVRYVGPGSEADPRMLKVPEDEAARLVKTGLWKKKEPKSTKEVKKNA